MEKMSYKNMGGVKRITPENKCKTYKGGPGWQGDNTGRGSSAPVTGSKSTAEGTLGSSGRSGR